MNQEEDLKKTSLFSTRKWIYLKVYSMGARSGTGTRTN
jgi:hypothetical protein